MSDELADLKPGAREEEDQKDEQDEQDDATELDEQQQAELNQKLLSAAANGELEEALELCQRGANPAYQVQCICRKMRVTTRCHLLVMSSGGTIMQAVNCRFPAHRNQMRV